VHLPLRKKNARAGADRRLRFSSPHEAGTLQDAEDFFVQMEVIGRAAGRDGADELRDLALNQLAIPAIASPLDGDVDEANRNAGRWPAGPPAAGPADSHDCNLSLQLQIRSRRQENPRIALEDVQNFVSVFVAQRRLSVDIDDPHRDRIAAKAAPSTQDIQCRHEELGHSWIILYGTWTRS